MKRKCVGGWARQRGRGAASLERREEGEDRCTRLCSQMSKRPRCLLRLQRKFAGEQVGLAALRTQLSLLEMEPLCLSFLNVLVLSGESSYQTRQQPTPSKKSNGYCQYSPY